MASTYVQQKRAIVKSLRRVRQLYRQANTQDAKLHRKLDSLIRRKTLITPEQLMRMVIIYESVVRFYNGMSTAIGETVTIASQ
jgi:phosphoglucomutase